MESNEVKPNDLDQVEDKEQQERMTAYEKRLAERGEGDFFNIKHVKENEIKIVKFSKWLGIKQSTFKDGTQQDRPNFEISVMVGKDKSTKYTTTLSDATVATLKKQGMPKTIGKEWLDKPLDITEAMGKNGAYIKYTVHVNL